MRVRSQLCKHNFALGARQKVESQFRLSACFLAHPNTLSLSLSLDVEAIESKGIMLKIHLLQLGFDLLTLSYFPSFCTLSGCQSPENSNILLPSL